jgi:hypothetical protein
VSTAFDSKTRRTGLLDRDHLPAGHALVIAPCNAVHTFFMKFPIDVAFVTRDGRVSKLRTAVAPWRIAASWRAFAVIELPAGTLADAGTVVGDRLEIEPGEPRSIPVTASPTS